MLKQKKKVPFRVILWLPTVLGTVNFAATVWNWAQEKSSGEYAY